ncbi:MAG: hypothetical protein ACREN3_00715 [Gemmatimonadaceae bacterium]
MALALGLVVATPLAAQHACPSPEAAGARRLPAVFDEGRVLLAPTDARGDTTLFILDSGGGFNAMSGIRLTQLGLTGTLEGTGADTGTVVPIAAFGDSMQLPVPVAGYPEHGMLAVTNSLRNVTSEYAAPTWGFLGEGWWADRVWRIDYLHRELWLYPRSVLTSSGSGSVRSHDVPLHFLTQDGRRPTNFARFRAVMDGDSLNLLWDTGATTQFTDSALAVIDDHGPSGRAGSFVSSEIFARWHSRHPEWRVIEHGETSGAALIEVPRMDVAGYTIGPVWWERRDSSDFHHLMDPLMDQPIQGSLGGAAFRYFTITIDYPNAMACFQR